jgi:hypothetical protein
MDVVQRASDRRLVNFMTYYSKLNAGPGNAISKGRLCTIDLLIQVACFVKNIKIVLIQKAADLNCLAHGGQLY